MRLQFTPFTLRILLATLFASPLRAEEPNTIAFVTGDGEYHSREVMVPYAKKLEEAYGFNVIYIADEERGANIDPGAVLNPKPLLGAERIKEADLMVVFIRFRSWDEDSLKLFMEHFESGKPAIGIRTTTHALWPDRTFSPKYFGGHYKTYYRRAMVAHVAPDHPNHPMVRGVPHTYRTPEPPYVSTPLSEGATPVVLSYTHSRRSDEVDSDSFDSPNYPIAWAFNHNGARRAMITLGNDRVDDHGSEMMQNLFYNSVFWSLGFDVPAGGVLAASADFKANKEVQPYAPAERAVPAPPPFSAERGWEVLFDGSELSKWKHWDVSIPPFGIDVDTPANSEGPIDYTKSPARWQIQDGAVLARVGYGDIVTKNEYSNYELRLDYLIPESPDWVTGEWRGNSGIYLNGAFEIAILDTNGQEPSDRSNGAIYRQKAPDIEASRPAGHWQTLEITLKEGKTTVVLNGKTIHKEERLNKSTPYGFKKNESGPIRLQAETSAVRFANIAIRPL